MNTHYHFFASRSSSSSFMDFQVVLSAINSWAGEGWVFPHILKKLFKIRVFSVDPIFFFSFFIVLGTFPAWLVVEFHNLPPAPWSCAAAQRVWAWHGSLWIWEDIDHLTSSLNWMHSSWFVYFVIFPKDNASFLTADPFNFYQGTFSHPSFNFALVAFSSSFLKH